MGGLPSYDEDDEDDTVNSNTHNQPKCVDVNAHKSLSIFDIISQWVKWICSNSKQRPHKT
jgi:hypothetical protein